MNWFIGLVDAMDDVNHGNSELPREYIVTIAAWMVFCAIGTLLTIAGGIISLLGGYIGTVLMACGGIVHTIGIGQVIIKAWIMTR